MIGEKGEKYDFSGTYETDQRVWNKPPERRKPQKPFTQKEPNKVKD